MAEIKFDIIKNIGILSEGAKGWEKEVNIIRWNGRKAKIDIRDWDEAHKKIGKGITLSKAELKQLKEVLNEINIGELDIEK
ncbi:PC4/YdbC family ssDNA-binding protein [Clostridium pasteurianum]|uniref:YdbC family protein n=1 Tax=Clostridium pasteurianum TaxID=1501 RepID=UPI00226093DA|nr:PC4/YdbC family ssDNA-binding protein [Clostridium pasteurianum]UZW12849.1 PC4/YdbC family ssDNA-binding protein [Clostridium pasteurianum]